MSLDGEEKGVWNQFVYFDDVFVTPQMLLEAFLFNFDPFSTKF